MKNDLEKIEPKLATYSEEEINLVAKAATILQEAIILNGIPAKVGISALGTLMMSAYYAAGFSIETVEAIFKSMIDQYREQTDS